MDRIGDWLSLGKNGQNTILPCWGDDVDVERWAGRRVVVGGALVHARDFVHVH